MSGSDFEVKGLDDFQKNCFLPLKIFPALPKRAW